MFPKKQGVLPSFCWVLEDGHRGCQLNIASRGRLGKPKRLTHNSDMVCGLGLLAKLSWPWVNSNGIPLWGRCTIHVSFVFSRWGLGCSLGVRFGF